MPPIDEVTENTDSKDPNVNTDKPIIGADATGTDATANLSQNASDQQKIADAAGANQAEAKRADSYGSGTAEGAVTGKIFGSGEDPEREQKRRVSNGMHVSEEIMRIDQIFDRYNRAMQSLITGTRETERRVKLSADIEYARAMLAPRKRQLEADFIEINK